MFDSNAGQGGQSGVVKEANTFDFSTVQTVNMTVDYSAFQTYGQVFFSIYSENPFVGEGDEERLDEAITPIYEDFTNAQGKFNMDIKLPAYAKHLYVVTGNYFVSETLMETEVVNGAAKAVATKTTPAMTRAANFTRGDGPQTDDVSTMPQLSFIVDNNGNNTGERIYKDWLTPLGTWDANTGEPSYLIQPGQVDAELLFSDVEMEGLFSAVGQALNTNKACNLEYRNQADLTLEKESEVTITLLGGNTCWMSTLGYYYYFDNQRPATTQDLNIIMLFPNTQDGEWSKLKSNQSYQGNIGVRRGDAVQLKYYPNIANNGDLSGETTVFPKGIRIGFILKTHGWGMQGSKYTIKGFNDSNRKYNVWGTSTNGISFCRPFGAAGVAPYQYPNPDGDSRTAKFSYISPEGDKYAIVSFEDACNDQDYDDVIFALKPVNSFTPLPEIEDQTTTTVGVYAFEDLWPEKGDYDMNDIVVDFKHEKTMSKQKSEKEFKLYKETFYLTTYQNYVTLKSGLAVRLNTPVTPSTISMKKIAKGSNEAVEANFVKDRDTNSGQDVYCLTDDVKAELGTTYILELEYATGQTQSNLATVQPFIYRNEPEGKTWEVHVPFEAPTFRMNLSYFGTHDDASSVKDAKYFVRDGNYPFAFFLYGAKIESFINTILERSNESKAIDVFYPGFLNWSLSGGQTDADWYLKPVQQ
ncbi:MAG: LruC domain-containing protein [Prevotella sp.]|nr:LruC domain-containing protein [Prevotella sp.]